MQATGTTRENRTEGTNKQLVQSKELWKKERGTYDYSSDGKVYIAKWHDNPVVNIVSKWKTHEPVGKVRPRVKGGAKEVTQPHLIASCNKGMSGADSMDRLLKLYPSTIRGNKWYWTLFVNFLNLTLVAVWRICFRLGQQKVSHPYFQRQVTLCWLKADKEPQNRPDGEAKLPQEVRFDGMNHFREATSQELCKMCKKIPKPFVKNAMYACMQKVATFVFKWIMSSSNDAPE